MRTDPEKIVRWMGTEAQVEPQPGGLYLVNVTGARFARGAFREVVPVHRRHDSMCAACHGKDGIPDRARVREPAMAESG